MMRYLISGKLHCVVYALHFIFCDTCEQGVAFVGVRLQELFRTQAKNWHR